MENEKVLHVLGRISIVSGYERVADNDENGAEELATGPGRSGCEFRADGVTQVGKQFDSNRHDGEAPCADDGENDIRTGKGLCLGHPYEDNEACRYDGDDDLQGEKEVLRAIQNGRRNGGGDKTDDDEDGAANAGLVIREAIRD